MLYHVKLKRKKKKLVLKMLFQRRAKARQEIKME